MTECPNCHNANKYGDYEGPACEVCHGDGEAPLQWHECPTCDGEGHTIHRITVYEAGCGFPHDDSEERPCERCKGEGGWLDDVKADR